MRYPAKMGVRPREVWLKAGHYVWQLLYGRWPCVQLVRSGHVTHEHPAWVAKRDRDEVLTMRKVIRKDPGDDAVPVKLGTWGARTPLLCDVLTSSCYDGKWELPREVGTLSLRLSGTVWQWSLTDPTSASVLRVEVSTPDEGFLALEKLLDAKDTPWQHAHWLESKKTRRKK